MFQPYKMKFMRAPYPLRSYIYKNCSIVVSREDGDLQVSICPHIDTNLPEKDELDGILEYLGINPRAPYETFVIRHPGKFDMGDSTYFVQAIS